jgi:hypothetical protein
MLILLCRLAAYETIPVDTDGDGIPDDEAVLLPAYTVNGNKSDTFDWPEIDIPDWPDYDPWDDWEGGFQLPRYSIQSTAR